MSAKQAIGFAMRSRYRAANVTFIGVASRCSAGTLLRAPLEAQLNRFCREKIVIVSRFQMLARLIGVAGIVLLACAAKGDVAVKYPEPEDGAVKSGVFEDDYFGLRYPLQSGWVEDLKGPEASASGYYSLAALKPEGELVATMQISAQDNFFCAGACEGLDGFSECDEEGARCEPFGSECSGARQIRRNGFCAP